MVEDKSVQAEVLKTGKVDTIVSEPIGVMLLHERMVSGGAGFGGAGWLVGWLAGRCFSRASSYPAAQAHTS